MYASAAELLQARTAPHPRWAADAREWGMRILGSIVMLLGARWAYVRSLGQCLRSRGERETGRDRPSCDRFHSQPARPEQLPSKQPRAARLPVKCPP